MAKPKSEYRAARREAAKAEIPGAMRRAGRKFKTFQPKPSALVFKHDAEIARRVHQIATGSLREQNGLVHSAT